MKKLTAILLALCLLLSLTAGCASQESPSTTAAPETTAAPTEPAPSGPSQAAIDALDGKKILFIGNSYTFFGRCVNYAGNTLTQAERTGDQGLFYHLCKQNGIDVEVTNWTFPGHDLTDMTTGECRTTSTQSTCVGVDHLSYLEDRNFDYVAIQCYFESEYAGDLATHLQPAMELFREANPNVKFLFLVPHMAYVRNFAWSGSDLASLSDTDITICNWGGMLDDIVNKRVAVPGGTQQYFQASFVVSKDESDGHHQNLLVGYLTALMTYCAITGESAVGQPYAFADDPSVNPEFDMEAFQKSNYIYEPFTNFVEIYRSEADMLGLQQLIDTYLAKYNEGN